MTKISFENPVVRETDSLYRNKLIMIELHTSYTVFRVKGMQKFRAAGPLSARAPGRGPRRRVAEGGREAP